ncbi:SusC/RagA family TonB-linked outer membrane protein [Kordia sp. TARA_039_SRF]|nr:SusC/RagA family TonB-linked outer membrane protein [Kordia sp. TARA_039_SRF]
MKKMQKFILFLAFLIPIGMFAQTKVTGVVTEKSTGTPLLGVNVVIKGTTTGTTTDFDGKYQISANDGQIIVFTYVGYKNQEIAYTGQATIDVALEEDASTLDEVVVVGYGSAVKKDVTGAVESVTSEDFNGGAIVSPEQLIAGKTAGVQVTPPSGAPGSGSAIKIRGGVSSLSASSAPLIVVDGVPLDQGSAGLNYINANDIESFTVLKDASAASIYGSRATGGVILITTKTGKSGQLNVNVNHFTSVGSNVNEVDVLSSTQFRDLVMANGNANQIDDLGNASTNWQDEIYRGSLTHDTNVTVSGGFDNSSYRASVGFVTQEGTLRTSEVDRWTGSLKFIQRLLNDDLRIEANVLGAILDDQFGNQGAIGAAVSFDPTQTVFDPNSPFNGYTENVNNDGTINTIAVRNPVGLIEQNDSTAETKRSTGSLKIDYTLPFFRDLKLTVKGGYDYNEVDGRFVIPDGAASNEVTDGLFGTNNTLNRTQLLDVFAFYKKDIESINTTIDVTAGHSFQNFYRSNRFLNVDGLDQVNSNVFKTENALESYFGRANISIADKYLITLNLRNDISSRLNPDDRSDIFGGVSLGWNIMGEKFMENSKVFSQLKLRAGYGETGQQEFGQDYGYIPRYTTGDGRVQYQFGYNPDGSPRFVTTIRPEEYDENLRWERSKTINLGLDFGFLNDRITGSVEVYERKVEDLINFISVPAGTNLSNMLFTNVGNLENRGLEVNLNTLIVDTEKFSWNTNFNVSFFDNEITKLFLTDDPTTPGSPTGGIAGGVGNTIQINSVGFEANSFYVFKQIYDANGAPIEGAYVDINGDGVVDIDDRYRYKSPNADAVLGFNSNMQYGNFDFSFTMRASLGNFAYNNVASNTGNIQSLFGANSINNVNASILDTGFQNQQLFSDYYVQDASFLKLDNLTIGYTFQEAFKNTRLRVYATGQNLFVITDYDGLDPEIDGGIDNNFYPRSRNILMGINLNL